MLDLSKSVCYYQHLIVIYGVKVQHLPNLMQNLEIFYEINTDVHWLVHHLSLRGAAYVRRPVTTAICYDVMFSNCGCGSPILFETICHSTFVLHNYTSKHNTFVGNFFCKRYKQYKLMHNMFDENPRFQESACFKWWALPAV